MTMADQIKSVGAIHAAQEFGATYPILAALKRRTGARIHYYCGFPEQSDYLRKFDRAGVFDTIHVAPQTVLAALRPVGGDAEIVDRARILERKLGVTLNLMAVADRHLGRGYALGGSRFFRSRASQCGYIGMLAAFVEVLEYWFDHMSRNRFDLVFGGSGEVWRVARALGIPFRILTTNRIDTGFYWAEDRFGGHAGVAAGFHGAEAGEIPPITGYLQDLIDRTNFFRAATLSGAVRDIARRLWRSAKGRIRNETKATQGYWLRDEIAFALRRWWHFRALSGPHAAKLTALENRPFVFYALQQEPEAMVGLVSPEFFFQQAAIAALSRDLPAGVMLAVKETVHAVGLRPAEFYRQIAELKNVVMLDVAERGIDIARKAAATVTMTGTVALEAALMGKPVLVFGRNNSFNLLPHVSVIRSFDDIRPALERALAGAIDPDRARLDAARYFKALSGFSFPLTDYRPGADANALAAEAETAVDRLLESLAASRPGGHTG
ncbi:MAG: hypothetical protein FJX46_01885 [Alphaproteobacteria bacterium]|nr:hypothetical protein [Alphaproteobacteria bacterium]